MLGKIEHLPFAFGQEGDFLYKHGYANNGVDPLSSENG